MYKNYSQTNILINRLFSRTNFSTTREEIIIIIINSSKFPRNKFSVILNQRDTYKNYSQTNILINRLFSRTNFSTTRKEIIIIIIISSSKFPKCSSPRKSWKSWRKNTLSSPLSAREGVVSTCLGNRVTRLASLFVADLDPWKIHRSGSFEGATNTTPTVHSEISSCVDSPLVVGVSLRVAEHRPHACTRVRPLSTSTRSSLAFLSHSILPFPFPLSPNCISPLVEPVTITCRDSLSVFLTKSGRIIVPFHRSDLLSNESITITRSSYSSPLERHSYHQCR